MMKVWMLVLSLCSFTAMASEFNHIKLNPQFEQYLTHPKMKSPLGAKSFAKSADAADEDINFKVRSALLGSSGVQTKSNFTSPFPTDGEESPLYEEIRAQLEASHQQIGLAEVANLDFLNRQFNLGTENFSGFSWQKPFGVAGVLIDRQVRHNILTGDNWVVEDKFTINIEATTFLEKLNEAGLANMSSAEIGAFAGITFKRVYTYWHYANSYREGLTADFSKLFLPFLKFNQNGILRMGNDEFMKREDYWTASAGGLITTPPVYNVSFSAGVLAQYAHQQKVTIQNNAPLDPVAEKIRVSVFSKNSASVTGTMSLQIDVFKLIKFTLLSADLSYEYASGREFNLGFSSNQLSHVMQDENEGPEYRSVLRGHGKIKVLEPYVVDLKESESSALASRGSLLIWGKLQKTQTEQIRVVKDQTVKVFYKNYSQSVRIVQNFLSRIFSAVVYKVFKLPVGAKNAAIYDRVVTLEYEATHPQAGNTNIARVEGTEQFSFVLTQSYEAARTDRWIDKSFKNDVIWFVDSFTSLPKDYKTIIRSEQLRGPLRVDSNFRVEKAGLDYFVAQSESSVFGHIARVCHSNRVNDWMKDDKRAKFLKALQIGKELCVKNIGKKYLAFRTDYLQNALKPSLAQFKGFLTKYYKQSEEIASLNALFGEENTFLNGEIQATTSTGALFVTQFSAGQFRGLGVIDTFKRTNGTRTPASIVSE